MRSTRFTPTAILFTLLALIALPLAAAAQQQPAPPDMQIDNATRTAVIDKLVAELNDGYVFPETAKKMEADLRTRQKAGEYDALTSAQEFSKKLTDDLQAVSKDKHLRVRFSKNVLPVRTENDKPTEAEKADQARYTRFMNAGFEKVERMKGNIGYVNLLGFVDPELGAETVKHAMGFLANTDALIFDLRENGGGDPAMVALISSYLFGDKPVHLNDLYWRKGDKTTEFWTKPASAATKFGDRDIYVLTSKRTFSGGEEFAYNLKNLKRATIIGETTGGGAHPGDMARLGDHFAAFVPTGRAISPITKANWEGTGVEPDIKVPKEQALKTAYLLALKKAVVNAKEEGLKASLNRLIEQTQKELDELKAKS